MPCTRGCARRPAGQRHSDQHATAPNLSLRTHAHACTRACTRGYAKSNDNDARSSWLSHHRMRCRHQHHPAALRCCTTTPTCTHLHRRLHTAAALFHCARRRHVSGQAPLSKMPAAAQSSSLSRCATVPARGTHTRMRVPAPHCADAMQQTAHTHATGRHRARPHLPRCCCWPRCRRQAPPPLAAGCRSC